MIQVENLSRRYGDFVAVDDVSFSIGQGEIVGLLGHNGAGKTTIMKMLTGYLEPSDGRITINNTNIEDAPASVQQLIGYLPENLPIYPEMTVMDYLFYCAEVRDIPRSERDEAVMAAIRKTELQSKAVERIETLSRGFKQRVGVAQALLHNPKLLILDEPTNGLDPRQTHQMRNLIRNLAEDATVILSTHIMQEVDALCDRVLILDSGSLAVNQSMDELRRSDTLVLETSADEATIKTILEDTTITSITPVSVESGRHTYHLPLKLDNDIASLCAHLAEKLIQSGQKLYTLYAQHRDLETVFRSIHEKKQEVKEARNAA